MQAITIALSTVGDLYRFLWKQKLWWLVPMITILLLAAAVLAVATATGLGPFIYTLF